jgi:hypothetical protein
MPKKITFERRGAIREPLNSPKPPRPKLTQSRVLSLTIPRQMEKSPSYLLFTFQILLPPRQSALKAMPRIQRPSSEISGYKQLGGTVYFHIVECDHELPKPFQMKCLCDY